MVRGCVASGSGQYKNAGQACIADRQAGGCSYKVNGQCWNWSVGYRDPIAKDPDMTANAAAASSASSIVPASVNVGLASTGIDPPC
jgi:hypothetical protein